MKERKFKKGQLVLRLGYTQKPYKVIGYNNLDMVLVIPFEEKDSFENRDSFMENQLRQLNDVPFPTS